MRQTNAKLLAEQKPLGVIDVLTAGFEIVRKRPWTVLVPVFLDLLIWLLPRLSLTGLFRPALDQVFPTADLPPDLAENARQLHDAGLELISSFHLLGLVSAGLDTVARFPSLLAFNAGDIHSPITFLAYTIQLQSGLLALVLFVPLFLLGLFVAAVYIELIAQGVRPLETELPLAWLARAALLWLRLIALSVILGLALLAGAGVLMVAGSLAPSGTDAGSFIAAVVAVGWFWLTIYFFFVICALAINQVGVLDAIRRSILVFRVHFWASLGLILLTVFLERGLGLIWSGLALPDEDLGILIAIVANAIIGTGLLAGSLVFYQDRLNYTERMLARTRVVRR